MTIVLEQRTLTARKEHSCNECRGVIAIGDRYERARIVDYAEAWTWKAHLLCLHASNEAARELELEYGDEGPSADEVHEVLLRVFGALAVA